MPAHVVTVTSSHSNNDPRAQSRWAVVAHVCKLAHEAGIKPAVVFSVEEDSGNFYGDSDADRLYFVNLTDTIRLCDAGGVSSLQVNEELKSSIRQLLPDTLVYACPNEAALQQAASTDGVQLLIWTGATSDKQLVKPDLQIHVATAGVDEGVSGKAIRRADLVVLCHTSTGQLQEAAQDKRELLDGFEPKHPVLELQVERGEGDAFVAALQQHLGRITAAPS